MTIKDSGHRRQFATGAQRDRGELKGRPVLMSPLVLRELSKHYEEGALKYEERNWELGMPLSEYFDSASRHMTDLHEGKTDENHAIAALWNMMCFIHTRIMIARGLLPEELDDMPDYTPDEYALDGLGIGVRPEVVDDEIVDVLGSYYIPED